MRKDGNVPAWRLNRGPPKQRDMLNRTFGSGEAVKLYIREKVDGGAVLLENRQLYLDWAHTLLAESLSFARVLKYTQVLMTFERFIRKPFATCTRRDIEDAVIELDHHGYRPHYLHDIKVTIRKFFKWLRQTDVYPDEVRWIHSVISKGQRRILPAGVLSETQVADIVNACRSPRDRAFLAVLYDSGCRLGEVRTMTIGSVSFDECGARIRVTGKTGDRSLRLTISVPLLASWFNMHPYRGEPDAPLWIGTHERAMRSTAFQQIVKRSAVRAGIRTRVYPHLFRHSRATFLANYLTEAQLCARFGWVQGSEQPGTYVHLSGRDSDDAILALYGLKRDGAREVQLLAPRPCARCGLANAFNCAVCVACGNPLETSTAASGIVKKPGLLRAEWLQ